MLGNGTEYDHALSEHAEPKGTWTDLVNIFIHNYITGSQAYYESPEQRWPRGRLILLAEILANNSQHTNKHKKIQNVSSKGKNLMHVSLNYGEIG